ncbi:MAG: hypothetical protein RLZZ205_686 [Bacteroidota bacterium]
MYQRPKTIFLFLLATCHFLLGAAQTSRKDLSQFEIQFVWEENQDWPKNTTWQNWNNQWVPMTCFDLPSQYQAVSDIQITEWFAAQHKQHISFSISSPQEWIYTTQNFEHPDGSKQTKLLVHPRKFENGHWLNIEKLSIQISSESNPMQVRGGNSYAAHSALSEGQWFQLAITKDGVYKVDKSILENLGINLNQINPQNINLYGNGGRMLSPNNSDNRPDDLTKLPIAFVGESDGVFNNNDYFLFYGEGADGWSLSHSSSLNKKRWFPNKHNYSDSAYYYIRIDDANPLRIVSSDNLQSPTHQVTQFQDFQFVENELINIGKAGREFYGETFSGGSLTYNFNFPNIIGSAFLEFGAVGKCYGGAGIIRSSIAGINNNHAISSIGTSSTSNFGNATGGLIPFTPNSSNVSTTFTFTPSSADDQAWMDFVSINVSRQMIMSGGQMKIRDTTAIGPNQIANYQLNNATNVHSVWNISSPTQPNLIVFNNNQGICEWRLDHSILQECLVVNNNSFLTPFARGRVDNQDIHGWSDVDLVIVTAPGHYSSAQALAEIHEAEGMVVKLIKPQQVYHEFSSGNPDVTAIRQMMKMLYDRANGNPDLQPKNLLLFGDGAYDTNRGHMVQKGFNVIVYESDYSLSPLASYVSDDYFVMLSPDDNASSLGYLDCGVGRIPAENAEEGMQAIDKIRAYLAKSNEIVIQDNCSTNEISSSVGPWRNVLTFVSDDQDGNGGGYEQVHLNSSDSLTRIVQRQHPEYDINKIYLDAYVQQSTPGGERYPDAQNAIKNRINAGSLIVTYVGHGGERGWAHERVLDIPTIQSFDNLYRLPVFLTATCELARFDDPTYKSAGELLVLNPNGGAIAMLTTTRVVFSGENFEMDLAFFEHALNDANDPELTLGKLNMLTKNGVSAGNDSKPNFSLLGDPALKLNYPKYEIKTTTINGIDAAVFSDTLKALEEVTIQGKIVNNIGEIQDHFNGVIYPVVYDKAAVINTQNNDDGVVQQYKTFNKILFKGKATVSNGNFEFQFPMPYDINYSVDFGRIAYYASSGTEDGHGYDTRFLIGGSSNDIVLNTTGPEIKLFMNDSTFVNGGTTHADPILLAVLKDENGINTAGNGIGHDIIGILDDQTNQPIVLNEFFESNLNTYKQGNVRYPFNSLSAGNHQLKIKAWDTHNNSSEKILDFIVADNEELVIEKLLNYPNPFTTRTSFYFEHNQACQDLKITIQVFTVSGKLVKTIQDVQTCTGFRTNGIEWNGRDDFEDPIGKGVYVYRVSVENPEGQRAEKFEKLVILR